MNFITKLFKKEKSITSTLTITSFNGFHLRPIAKFVNEVKKYDANITLYAKEQRVMATQVPKILSLSLEKNETFTLECLGKEAQTASDELSEFFKQLMQDDKEIEIIEQEEEKYETSSYEGEIIAKGVGIAPLIAYELHESSEGRHHSGLSLQEALHTSRQDLNQLYEDNKHNKNEAQIFLAQKELISTPDFDNLKENALDFRKHIEQEIEKLKGGKFESRIADYLDVRQRVLSHLGIMTRLKLPSTPYLFLADNLLPSDIAKLEKTPIEGVILQKGTRTSHAAILLRSANIPSVIINQEIPLVAHAILDASSGQLMVDPSPADTKRAKQKKKEFREKNQKSYEKRFKETKTRQGNTIKVLANVTDLLSVKEAKEQGADGIGLLRTEFLFKEQKPSITEQTNSYIKIFEYFDEVTIRTLDIGGDKSLPYVEIQKEDNPFLGIRGIRFSLQEETLFKEQLLAIFKAVKSNSSQRKIIKIMFPMISTPEEFIEAKKIASDVAKEHKLKTKNIKFGIMLEVPSVIFALSQFDQLVDFYSIGTNDLSQYLFAIERTHPTLKVDPTSPMLMNALKMIIEGTNKPLTICGELAGLEEVTEELITMGYEQLSVSGKLIPNIKERIRHS